ncbi:MAG: TonB-dependent receptor [Cyclobacteriaceae bacterium]
MNVKLRKLLLRMSKIAIYTSIFCYSLSMALATESVAQRKHLNEINFEIQMSTGSILSLFQEIESSSDFTFAYSERELKGKLISLNKRNWDLNALLKEVSVQVGVSFRRINETITVKKVSKKVALPDVEESITEKQTVEGTVTDENGEGLPGATILEKGTNNGTVADVNGQFRITVSDENSILVFTFVGYKTQEVQLNNRAVIDVTMSPDVASLNEVVVIGYGTQNQNSLTGSVVSVKQEDFTQGANYDALQLLNGAASGVNVSQVSSAPGAELSIQIRGAGSISSDNSVLFVVDGLPGVSPSSLSPDDIESIEVLKDASAAAIYGTRAANGVVLITTKKGKAGKAVISYSMYTGFQSVESDLDVLGAKDYAEMVNFREISAGGSAIYTDQQISGFGSGSDWQEEIFRDAVVQNHQLSISGGSDKSNYYLGLNYFDQEGVIKTSGSEKYNIRLNVQSSPTSKLLISANANFTRQVNDEILVSNGANEGAGPISSAIQYDPTLSGIDPNTGRYARNTSIALDHPIALIEGIDNTNIINRFYSSLSMDYDILKNLTATVRLGGDISNSRRDFYRSRVTDIGLGNGGLAQVNSVEATHWLTEALLTYRNSSFDDHNFSLMGGATLEEFVTTGLGATGGGFLSDGTTTNLLQGGNGDLSDGVSSSKFKNQLNGFIGRGTYDYKGKYLLTAAFRVDGSSRFSEDNRYAFFPSASLGWRLSEEAFFKDLDAIDDLKLRLGYGELGNQGINNFETRQTLIAGSNSVFDGNLVQGVRPARLPNPDLKWETTKEVNLGIDYSLFNDRISGSIDLFNRVTTDQLFIKPLPSVVGFSSVRTNFGEVANKGIDLAIKTENVRNKDFTWSSSLNLSFLKNEVTKLPDFTQEIIGGRVGTFITQYTTVREGAALRSYYGYEINGIFQEGDDIANSATPTFSAGMPRFVDQDGDGDVDANDRVILGDPFPDYTFGFRNVFKYQNLSLSVLLLGVQGIDVLNANVAESLYPTNTARNSISRYWQDRWTPSNPSNKFPSGENPSTYGGALAINSLTITDASFVRMKNVTLGYDVPVENISWVSMLNIYVSIDNLFTITDFEGYDPDANAEGLDPVINAQIASEDGINSNNGVSRSSYNSYPLARTVRLGLNVKF